LVSSGKSATNAGSENELIRQMVPKMRFSATSSAVPLLAQRGARL
jgi:hypothetical protein